MDSLSGNILIVESSYYEDITGALIEGASRTLEAAEKSIERITVPGVFEIPAAIQFAWNEMYFDGCVTLGCVIRGETDHYEYVSNEAANGIAEASRSTGIPVIFGVLTTNTVEQAINRSGEKQSNMGYTCGINAIEMANLVHDIKML